jgi:AraC-like DNA-binding protein
MVGTVRRMLGEANGNTRLSDAQVRQMRKLREREGWSYLKLAAMFGVSYRHAARVCTGQQRQEAGGPIAPYARHLSTDGEPIGLATLPIVFDQRVVIVCQRCRRRAHPCVHDRAICFACWLQAVIEDRAAKPSV